MFDFIFAAGNGFFAIAISLLVMMILAELAGSLVDVHISELFNSLLPVPDLDDAGRLTGILRWLRIDQLPVFETLLVFLLCFSLVGYGLQLVLYLVLGVMLPAFIAVFLVFFLSIPLMRLSVGRLAAKFPDNATLLDLVDFLKSKLRKD